MTDITENEVETSDGNQKQEHKHKKHRFLKLFAKIFLATFIIFFIVSRCSLYQNESALKESYINANNLITKQYINIDKVKIDFRQGVSKLINFAVGTPENFTLNALAAEQIIIFTKNEILNQMVQSNNLQSIDRTKIKELMSVNQESKNLVTYGAVIGNLTINYEIINGKVNLHQIIDEIISSLKTEGNFSPLAIYNLQKEFPLNYTGSKFKVEKVVIINPTINIYRDQELIKSIKSEQNIVIKFNDIKQPTTYAHYLLASSLKLVNILDNFAN